MSESAKFVSFSYHFFLSLTLNLKNWLIEFYIWMIKDCFPILNVETANLCAFFFFAANSRSFKLISDFCGRQMLDGNRRFGLVYFSIQSGGKSFCFLREGKMLVYTWITCFQLEIWPQCPQRKEPFNELVEFVSVIPLLLLPTSCDVDGVVKVFWELKLSVWCVLDEFELLACNWLAPPPRVVRRFRLWTLVDDEVPAWPFNKLFMIWNGIWMGKGGGGASSIPALDCFSCGVPSSR